MSRTDHDDAFAAELRSLANTEQPLLDLDPATVTRRGRALRRRRAVRTGGLAVLVTAVVAGGALQLARLDPVETGPAHPTQEPRTLDDEHTAELAPGVIAPHTPEGSPLPFTSLPFDDALPRAFTELFSPLDTVPATLPGGDELRPMAVTADGRVVAGATPPDSFSGDEFLAPERLGWWTPDGFEPFGDVSGLPEGDPFRYSYFAATDGEAVTWVETSSVQGLGRWRIFADSPGAGTQLVAHAEQSPEPASDTDHDFGSEALPHPLGDRAVWTSYSSYSNSRDSGHFLLSAPLDGSGPMRIESETASSVAVTSRGAVFAREGGTVISVLREDGSIKDLLHYPFETTPHVSLAAEGNLLAVSAWFRDDLDASWIDVIDLDTMSVTRVERAEGIGERLSVCGDRVVWSTATSGEDAPYSAFLLLEAASRTLTSVRADDGGVPLSCAGNHLVWSTPDDTGLRSKYELVTFD